MKRRLTEAMAAASLLTLAGCGGGGSGDGAAGGGAPPGPAATAPAPSPAPFGINPAPFGVTQDTPMEVLGLVDSADMRWLQPGEVQLRWDAARRLYAATIPSYGSGTLVDDAAEAAPSGLLFLDGQGQTIARANIFPPQFGGDAALLGGWAPVSGAPTAERSAGSFIMFPPTAIQNPPAAGAVSFLLGGEPANPARLTIDFAAGTVTGMVPLTWTDAWGPYPEQRYPLENGVYDRATGRITGAFSVPGSEIGGEVRGQILLANGSRIALAIRGAVRDPYQERFVPGAVLNVFVRE